jgi:hypothetical protein
MFSQPLELAIRTVTIFNACVRQFVVVFGVCVEEKGNKKSSFCRQK